MDRPEQPWILSDRDVWYANPFYQGPKARHPEDDQEWDDDRDIEAGQFREAYEAAHPAYPFMGWDHLTLADDDAGMPF
jgi:hypothetical protein